MAQARVEAARESILLPFFFGPRAAATLAAPVPVPCSSLLMKRPACRQKTGFTSLPYAEVSEGCVLLIT